MHWAHASNIQLNVPGTIPWTKIAYMTETLKQQLKLNLNTKLIFHDPFKLIKTIVWAFLYLLNYDTQDKLIIWALLYLSQCTHICVSCTHTYLYIVATEVNILTCA